MLKKLFFIILIQFSFCLSINAQFVSKFKMNFDGSFTTSDNMKYDIMLDDRKSASELFDRIKRNIALVYNSPKDVESNVEDKVISVYGFADRCTYFTAPGMKFYLSFHYTLKFQFKDGKIRIDSPYLVDMIGSPWKNLQETFKAKSIFNKDGTLSTKDSKRKTVIMLENYFNTIIQKIVNGDSEKDGDW